MQELYDLTHGILKGPYQFFIRTSKAFQCLPGTNRTTVHGPKGIRIAGATRIHPGHHKDEGGLLQTLGVSLFNGRDQILPNTAAFRG